MSIQKITDKAQSLMAKMEAPNTTLIILGEGSLRLTSMMLKNCVDRSNITNINSNISKVVLGSVID